MPDTELVCLGPPRQFVASKRVARIAYDHRGAMLRRIVWRSTGGGDWSHSRERGHPTRDSPTDSQGRQNSTDISGVNKILLSELVFYYKFYDWLTSLAGANLRQIILSPPEFIVIMLVIATGILGSFMFHTYTMFLAKNTSEYPSLSSIALRATLSVMCALVIYILSRTGFVAITEGSQRGVKSPSARSSSRSSRLRPAYWRKKPSKAPLRRPRRPRIQAGQSENAASGGHTGGQDRG